MKVLHLDMDSFFATVEQQARPSWRGRPVGVSLAPSKGGTLVAASIEAKRHGIGTGTKVGDALAILPDLILVKPNPGRYRTVHRRFRRILEEYSPDVRPRSIDEASIWFTPDLLAKRSAVDIGEEMKQRIRNEVGDWLSASVGIGPNWLLAKTASAFNKPDGLYEITSDNIRDTLAQLKLRDLCGIAHRMEARMQLAGIGSPIELYDTPPWELKRRFGMVGYYWHLRLHGAAIDTQERATRSLSHSSVIPKPTERLDDLRPLLHKLCQKVGQRLRREGWTAGGISVTAKYGNYGALRDERNSGTGGLKLHRSLTHCDDNATIFRAAWQLLSEAIPEGPPAPVRHLAVWLSPLRVAPHQQLSLFTGDKLQAASAAVDAVNDRWGDYTVRAAAMKGAEKLAGDSIAFGQDVTRERANGRYVGR